MEKAQIIDRITIPKVPNFTRSIVQEKPRILCWFSVEQTPFQSAKEIQAYSKKLSFTQYLDIQKFS